MVFEDKDGVIRSVMHVRGLSLQSEHVDPYVNADRMEEFARGVLNGERMETSVPQFNLSVFDGERHVHTCYSVKRFRSPIVGKRVVLPDSLYEIVQTMPYGFSEALFDSVKMSFNNII